MEQEAFLMQIQDVFLIRNREVAVTGVVEKDVIETGARLLILDAQKNILQQAQAIDLDWPGRAKLPEKVKAQEGDSVAVMLSLSCAEMLRPGGYIAIDDSLGCRTAGGGKYNKI